MSIFKTLLQSAARQIGFSRVFKAADAYDRWAEGYDQQADNLLVCLDDKVFTEMIKEIPVSGRAVIDVGCGTGRYWERLLAQQPASLTGYDVSAGMLEQLRKKFPQARAFRLSDEKLHANGAGSCDLLLCTLAIGYMDRLGHHFKEWDRVLKNGGDILITDFHPEALARGGKRTFVYQGKTREIRNFIYPIDRIRELADAFHWKIERLLELPVDESVRHFYSGDQAVETYEREKGLPLVYGIHLKKIDAVK